MADIFLSYSSTDRERIRPLVNILEQRGWSVWWDRKIPPGKTWHQVIQQALDESRCVVVVWSQHSIQSDWVITEAEEGKDRQARIPVLIDDVKAPLAFRRIHAARLVDWQGEASHNELAMLFESVTAIAGERELTSQSLPPHFASSDDSTTDFSSIEVEKTPKHEEITRPHSKSSSVISLEFKQEGAPIEVYRAAAKQPDSRLRNFIEDLGGNVKLEMIYISNGEFLMGSNEFDDEKPIHRVRLSSYFIGKVPVTQAQWKAVMGVNPSRFKGDGLPVESVSWDDAVNFCKTISAKTGKAFRLPTEAEWEMACRAGSTGKYCFGDEEKLLGEYAWYWQNSEIQTHPVGQKKANAWGLFDMHGNVWEWCADWYDDKYYAECERQGVPSDPQGPATGSGRLGRGGGWTRGAVDCRSADRSDVAPGSCGGNLGFRLVRAGR